MKKIKLTEGKKEILSLINHLKNNKKNLKIAAAAENNIINYFKKLKFIEFNTPIITHGMREYNIAIASIILSDKKIYQTFLRQSPQFEKQLITMATRMKYCQKAASVRPGDSDCTHVPYLHQLDIEIPYSLKKNKYEKVQQEIIGIIDKGIREGLKILKSRIAPTIQIAYKEAMKKFRTGSPYIPPPSPYTVQLIVVKNPPLFQKRKKIWDTTILPMAQPIWETQEQEGRFKNNRFREEELKKIEVYGYDFIICSAAITNKIKTQQEGLEIGGGSIRIKDPEIQYLILKKVRREHIKTFAPLIEVLKYFKNSDVFTAGGAIGLERLSMIASKQKNINDIVSIPWKKGKPPFV